MKRVCLILLFAVVAFSCSKDDEVKEKPKVKKLVVSYTEPNDFRLEWNEYYKFKIAYAESHHPDYKLQYKDGDRTKLEVVKSDVTGIKLITDYVPSSTMGGEIEFNKVSFRSFEVLENSRLGSVYAIQNISIHGENVKSFKLELYAMVDDEE